MSANRLFSILLMLAYFFVGLGYLAITPIFEGFDESAHYSSMRQIADTGTLPVLGISTIDQTYLNYQGPYPYNVFKPFDASLTYTKFFDQPALVTSYHSTYRDKAWAQPFLSSDKSLNWQAQHPPLYYLLMAPILKGINLFSLVTQFFILRLISYLFALVGVGFGILALRGSTPRQESEQSLLGWALYPIISPMFFPEFARLGNDALCLFWVGLLVFLLSKWRRDERSIKYSLAIGVTLGLGLLTKALFLPIVAALAGFLCIRLWYDRKDSAAWRQRCLSLVCIFYPALLIAGWWYLSRLFMHADLSGGVDAIILGHRGGLFAGLKDHFSLYALARSILSTCFTYTWAGTQSYTLPPPLFRIPLLILIFWALVSYVSCLRRKLQTDFMWWPIWLLFFFAASLFYHIIIGLALDGMGQTPGWYLHILIPIIAPAIGIGIYPLLQKNLSKYFVIALLLYASLFQVLAVWAQFSLFTGCAIKDDKGYYAFPDNTFCLDQTSLMINHLAVLGWPLLAAIGFGGGLICILAIIAQKTYFWQNQLIRQGKS